MAEPTHPPTLADRLQKALKAADVTQRELSRLAGLKHSYAGLVVRGQRKNLWPEPLAKIAAVLGVSTDWLITGAGPEPSARRIRSAVAAAKAKATARTESSS